LRLGFFADTMTLSTARSKATLRFSVPHPIPYQGSKRRLASAILSYIPEARYTRLVEPFAGSAAVTLAAAHRDKFPSYLIGDSLVPLIELWRTIIADPSAVALDYEALWRRERTNPIKAYYEIRAEFNADQSPAKLLYLLARCVKNAVRFNPAGEFNQSADKRRKGTSPDKMRSELFAAHRALSGHCEAVHDDFFSIFLKANEGDFFYLDPPYQGTSVGRDARYIGGVSRDKIGVDPKDETRKIETHCSERRFEWQEPEYTHRSFGFQWRNGCEMGKAYPD